MESSEHNWANISETICPKLLIFWRVSVLDVVLSEYPNKSHNFTNFIFYDVTLRYSIVLQVKSQSGVRKLNRKQER